ncbi:(Fe-S)-binding protein [Luteolibacter luteus]|uniref:Glycolate oxidase iron-sulfur subunit n=1 Tax=Luteolibacter luteus TaxID=2728835 RepID=A0A858RCM6_9BACT|nr:(Fe-S)-binding protein [Luteolibacter luteus]QJE94348.1 (Fe-S)-binding protein [Luteolibacter luteus]
MTPSLREIDYSVLQQCMHCGMCLPTCPTYDTTRRERNSPRGRIALMRSIADGELQLGKEFAKEMSYCLGCLACQTACPAGVDYARLFETARADIERQGIQDEPSRIFWRTLTLRILFMNPRLLRLAGRVLYFYQKAGFDRAMRRLGLMRLLPGNLRRLEPQTPQVCSRFSHDLIRADESPAGETRHRVALLTGCVQDLAFSSINRDTADVLLANGCAVHTPAWQPCCGSLHAHNGEPEMAAVLARRMIDLLPPEEFDAIITNAGGCGSHLRHYSHLLADDPRYAERAREWDRKVRDIHEWLVAIGPRVPGASPFESETTVTYHESCHLTHGQKIVAQPRVLLRMIPGLRYVELPEASWCCGSAGVYNITQPEQSARMLDRKISHIAGTRALVLATSNPGCHLQIARGLREQGLAVTVEQPVTLLARAYRRETLSA